MKCLFYFIYLCFSFNYYCAFVTFSLNIYSLYLGKFFRPLPYIGKKLVIIGVSYFFFKIIFPKYGLIKFIYNDVIFPNFP